MGSVIASYKKSPYYIKDTFLVSVRGFAKSFILFFLNPLHINKDTRLQNIDVCEDIFAVKKVIVCLSKRSSHNYPTITGKNFDVFPKIHLTIRKSPFT